VMLTRAGDKPETLSLGAKLLKPQILVLHRSSRFDFLLWSLLWASLGCQSREFCALSAAALAPVTFDEIASAAVGRISNSLLG
jgi:hypothetical protein